MVCADLASVCETVCVRCAGLCQDLNGDGDMNGDDSLYLDPLFCQAMVAGSSLCSSSSECVGICDMILSECQDCPTALGAVGNGVCDEGALCSWGTDVSDCGGCPYGSTQGPSTSCTFGSCLQSGPCICRAGMPTTPSSSVSAGCQSQAEQPPATCPYTNDGKCDETTGLCVHGTDTHDCQSSSRRPPPPPSYSSSSRRRSSSSGYEPPPPPPPSYSRRRSSSYGSPQPPSSSFDNSPAAQPHHQESTSHTVSYVLVLCMVCWCYKRANRKPAAGQAHGATGRPAGRPVRSTPPVVPRNLANLGVDIGRTQSGTRVVALPAPRGSQLPDGSLGLLGRTGSGNREVVLVPSSRRPDDPVPIVNPLGRGYTPPVV